MTRSYVRADRADAVGDPGLGDGVHGGGRIVDHETGGGGEGSGEGHPLALSAGQRSARSASTVSSPFGNVGDLVGIGRQDRGLDPGRVGGRCLDVVEDRLGEEVGVVLGDEQCVARGLRAEPSDRNIVHADRRLGGRLGRREQIDEGGRVLGVGGDAEDLARVGRDVELAVVDHERSAGRCRQGVGGVLVSRRVENRHDPTGGCAGTREPRARGRQLQSGPSRNWARPTAATRSPTLMSPCAANRPPTSATSARKHMVSSSVAAW